MNKQNSGPARFGLGGGSELGVVFTFIHMGMVPLHGYSGSYEGVAGVVPPVARLALVWYSIRTYEKGHTSEKLPPGYL